MPKKVSPKERRSKTVSMPVTAEEYAALKALAWLTNQTISMLLYDLFKPWLQELIERPEIQRAMQLGKPLIAPLTGDEVELRELAAWLEKDRLAQ